MFFILDIKKNKRKRIVFPLNQALKVYYFEVRHDAKTYKDFSIDWLIKKIKNL